MDGEGIYVLGYDEDGMEIGCYMPNAVVVSK